MPSKDDENDREWWSSKDLGDVRERLNENRMYHNFKLNNGVLALLWHFAWALSIVWHLYEIKNSKVHHVSEKGSLSVFRYDVPW
jgi:hypothetical protein